MADNKANGPVVLMDCDGTLYVTIDYSGIDTLVAIADAMSMAAFPNNKKLHLKVAEVIEWHEKEGRKGSGSNRAVHLGIAEHFKGILSKHANGKTIDA